MPGPPSPLPARGLLGRRGPAGRRAGAAGSCSPSPGLGGWRRRQRRCLGARAPSPRCPIASARRGLRRAAGPGGGGARGRSSSRRRRRQRAAGPGRARGAAAAAGKGGLPRAEPRRGAAPCFVSVSPRCRRPHFRFGFKRRRGGGGSTGGAPWGSGAAGCAAREPGRDGTGGTAELRPWPRRPGRGSRQKPEGCGCRPHRVCARPVSCSRPARLLELPRAELQSAERARGAGQGQRVSVLSEKAVQAVVRACLAGFLFFNHVGSCCTRCLSGHLSYGESLGMPVFSL